MKNCTRPATVSASASGMPLKGTCTTSIAAIALKISAAKWVPLPTPWIDRGRSRVRRGNGEQRVAIGRCARHLRRGERAAGAGTVLDDDLLAPALAELLREMA